MKYAPIARIILRYVVGAAMSAGYISKSLGYELQTDSDIIMLTALGIGAAVEFAYIMAKRHGGST